MVYVRIRGENRRNYPSSSREDTEIGVTHGKKENRLKNGKSHRHRFSRKTSAVRFDNDRLKLRLYTRKCAIIKMITMNLIYAETKADCCQKETSADAARLAVQTSRSELKSTLRRRMRNRLKIEPERKISSRRRTVLTRFFSRVAVGNKFY